MPNTEKLQKFIQKMLDIDGMISTEQRVYFEVCLRRLKADGTITAESGETPALPLNDREMKKLIETITENLKKKEVGENLPKKNKLAMLNEYRASVDAIGEDNSDKRELLYNIDQEIMATNNLPDYKKEKYDYSKPMEVGGYFGLFGGGLLGLASMIIPGGAFLLGIGAAVLGAGMVSGHFAKKFKGSYMKEIKHKISAQELLEQEEEEEALAFIEKAKELELELEKIGIKANEIDKLMHPESESDLAKFAKFYDKYGFGFAGNNFDEMSRSSLLATLDGHKIRHSMLEGLEEIAGAEDYLSRNILVNEFVAKHFGDIPPEDRKDLKGLIKNGDLTQFRLILTELDRLENGYMPKLDEQKQSLAQMRDEQIARITNHPSLNIKLREKIFERYGTTICKHFANDPNFNQDKLKALTANLPESEKEKFENFLINANQKLLAKITRIEDLAKENAGDSLSINDMRGYANIVSMLTQKGENKPEFKTTEDIVNFATKVFTEASPSDAKVLASKLFQEFYSHGHIIPELAPDKYRFIYQQLKQEFESETPSLLNTDNKENVDSFIEDVLKDMLPGEEKDSLAKEISSYIYSTSKRGKKLSYNKSPHEIFEDTVEEVYGKRKLFERALNHKGTLSLEKKQELLERIGEYISTRQEKLSGGREFELSCVESDLGYDFAKKVYEEIHERETHPIRPTNLLEFMKKDFGFTDKQFEEFKTALENDAKLGYGYTTNLDAFCRNAGINDAELTERLEVFREQNSSSRDIRKIWKKEREIIYLQQSTSLFERAYQAFSSKREPSHRDFDALSKYLTNPEKGPSVWENKEQYEEFVSDLQKCGVDIEAITKILTAEKSVPEGRQQGQRNKIALKLTEQLKADKTFDKFSHTIESERQNLEQMQWDYDNAHTDMETFEDNLTTQRYEKVVDAITQEFKLSSEDVRGLKEAIIKDKKLNNGHSPYLEEFLSAHNITQRELQEILPQSLYSTARTLGDADSVAVWEKEIEIESKEKSLEKFKQVWDRLISNPTPTKDNFEELSSLLKRPANSETSKKREAYQKFVGDLEELGINVEKLQEFVKEAEKISSGKEGTKGKERTHLIETMKKYAKEEELFENAIEVITLAQEDLENLKMIDDNHISHDRDVVNAKLSLQRILEQASDLMDKLTPIFNLAKSGADETEIIKVLGEFADGNTTNLTARNISGLSPEENDQFLLTAFGIKPSQLKTGSLEQIKETISQQITHKINKFEALVSALQEKHKDSKKTKGRLDLDKRDTAQVKHNLTLLDRLYEKSRVNTSAFADQEQRLAKLLKQAQDLLNEVPYERAEEESELE